MTTIQLREWTTRHGLDLSLAQRDLLRKRFDVRLQPTPAREGRFDVTPKERIGAAMIGDTAVVIQPKIAMNRLLFLLEYTADPAGWRDDHGQYDTAPDLMTAMAGLFARLATQATSRGLLAGYRQVDDYLHTVRGRIDLANQLRRRPGLDLPIAVTYQHHDEDIPENRLLAAAVRMLRPLPIGDPVARRSLSRLADALRDVASIHSSHNARIVWTRHNSHYRAAVEVARLLLEHSSIDVAAGTTAAPAIVLDMNDVFEQFVRSALRHVLGVSDSEFPDGDGTDLRLDVQSAVVLKPDLSLWQDGRCVFVGDVKYKRDAATGHNPDLYQLLAYATGTALPEATLVYADGPHAPAVHHIPGPGITLHRRRLDLTLPPSALLQQIGILADHLRAHSRRASADHRHLTVAA